MTNSPSGDLAGSRPRAANRDPYRSRHVLTVALQLAALDMRLFPTHGMRSARTPTGAECDCMKGRRFFAERDGIELIPCQSPGKLPKITDWPNQASCDPDQLRAWRARWPKCNFGLVTGLKSRVWILDVDGKQGFDSLAEIERAIGPLPKTWMSQSGSGEGRHYWWALPSGLTIRNSQGTLAQAIDVRGENGQILIPGSRHKSGGFYAWEPGCAPSETELIEAPEALVELALEANKATRRTSEPKPKRARSKPPVGPSACNPSDGGGGLLGDGEGGEGYHGPINKIAIRYFGAYGTDAEAEPLMEALRRAISTAPSHNHQPQEIERYMSPEYLHDRIEGARAYVRENAQ